MRVEVDLAHRDADAAAGLGRDVDFAAAADRAGRHSDGGGGALVEAGIDVGHVQSLRLLSERETDFPHFGLGGMPTLPPPVLAGSGSTGRGLFRSQQNGRASCRERVWQYV